MERACGGLFAAAAAAAAACSSGRDRAYKDESAAAAFHRRPKSAWPLKRERVLTPVQFPQPSRHTSCSANSSGSSGSGKQGHQRDPFSELSRDAVAQAVAEAVVKVLTPAVAEAMTTLTDMQGGITKMQGDIEWLQTSADNQRFKAGVIRHLRMHVGTVLQNPMIHDADDVYRLVQQTTRKKQQQQSAAAKKKKKSNSNSNGDNNNNSDNNNNDSEEEEDYEDVCRADIIGEAIVARSVPQLQRLKHHWLPADEKKCWDVAFVARVSATLDVKDVDRAAKHARLLRKLIGYTEYDSVVGVVIGEDDEVSEAVLDRAAEYGYVIVVTNRKTRNVVRD